ncbi:GNAT family N-acetyltransferase [Streptomyces sp. NPDC054840]
MGAGPGAGLGGRSPVRLRRPGDRPGRVVLRATRGHVVLKEVAPGKAAAEVGYWTAAGARGRGCGPPSRQAVTAWSLDAFRAAGLERLELLHQVDNRASCRVAVQARTSEGRFQAGWVPAACAFLNASSQAGVLFTATSERCSREPGLSSCTTMRCHVPLVSEYATVWGLFRRWVSCH